MSLELEGKTLSPLGATTAAVNVDAGGEQRVDFRVKVPEEGQAVIRMKVLTDVESDAVEMKFPVFVHGMLKTDSYSGVDPSLPCLVPFGQASMRPQLRRVHGEVEPLPNFKVSEALNLRIGGALQCHGSVTTRAIETSCSWLGLR